MTTDDAISRQAVDDYIVKLLSGYLYDEERTRLEELSAYLWELPSVKPQEPKTGKWIEERTYMECPNCHDVWHYEENQTERFKFCPNCDAKMKRR